MDQTKRNNWFRSYCFLWAAATLFHQASLWRLARNPVALILTLVATVVLLSPKRLGFLLLLSAAQVVEVFVHAPYYSNHWLLTTTVNITLLLSALLCAWKERSLTPDREAVLSLFVPSVRCVILVMYFWAVFHKLNSGFFTPESSCATDLLDGFGPLVPDAFRENTAVRYAGILATLAVETLIPVLLYLRRTRHLGAWVGAAFHFIIGFNLYEAYYNFSSALLAIFWLFLDPAFVDAGIDSLERKLDRLRQSYLWPFGVFAARLAFGFILVWLGTWGETSSKYQPFMVTVWVLYGAAYLAFVGSRVRALGPGVSLTAPAYQGFLPAQRAMLAVPLLLFLNGLSPYVGGKTEQSLAMFSNLVTEEGRSNHFIIRKPVYLFPFQKHLVRIIETNDPTLEKLRQKDLGMVWFEFRDHLSRNPDASVVYRRAGETITVPRAGDDPVFQEKTPLLARKYLFFRNPDLKSPPRCQH